MRNFLSAQLDIDGYMRCDYNVAGTKTYRLASRKNVRGRGTNLANLPSHGKIDLRYSLLELDYGKAEEETGRLSFAGDTETVTEQLQELQFTEVAGDLSIYSSKVELPNIKQIFLPDNNEYIFFDGDYSAGDLHFVAWEAGCCYIKKVLRAGGCVYAVLASEYFQREIVKIDGEWPHERQMFKAICHGTNYLGQAPTLAAKEGLKVSAVKNIIAMYFKLCPEIPEWQEYVKNFALTHGYVENIWGARGEVYDFSDPMWMNKIIAWIPQSSLAILVNKALVALEKNERQMITDKWDFDSATGLIVPRKQIIEAKLQTHDSISGQFIRTDFDAVRRIKQYMEVVIPYEDTLIIPAAVKIGETYGGCKKLAKDSPYLQWEKA